jgi:hypothetical protein
MRNSDHRRYGYFSIAARHIWAKGRVLSCSILFDNKATLQSNSARQYSSNCWIKVVIGNGYCYVDSFALFCGDLENSLINFKAEVSVPDVFP